MNAKPADVGLIPDNTRLGAVVAHFQLAWERAAWTSVRVSNSTERTHMKSGIRDKVEGAAKDAKGTAKQKWGKAAGDPATHMQGTKDRVEGKFQKKTGEIKRDIMRES